MKIKIFKEVFDKYPKAQIGYVIADVNVEKLNNYVEKLKAQLFEILKKNGITNKNYKDNAHINGWRNVFQDFGFSYKTHCSSLEALLKRVVQETKMWNINSVVDLYNCCSVLSMLPMGGYDVTKINKNIYVRYGKNDDKFEPLGMTGSVKIEPNHLVYVDDEKVLCWLWNFRDSAKSAIDENTKRAIFFLDSAFDTTHMPLNKALSLFEECLGKLNSKVLTNGILDAKNAEIDINSFDNLKKTIISEDDSVSVLTSLLKAAKLGDEPKRTANAAVVSNVKDVKDFMVSVPFKPVSVEAIATSNQIIHAAATGNLELIKRLIEFDSTLVNSQDWFGNNLIIHAVRGKHLDTLNYLKDAKFGLDLKHRNEAGLTALDMASNDFKNNLGS